MDLLANKHVNPYLQASFNKYREESFHYSLLNTVETREEANEQELIWITSFKRIDQSFNLRGDNTVHDRGRESIEKHRKAMIGRKNGPHSEATRNKIGAANRGRSRPDMITRNKQRRFVFVPTWMVNTAGERFLLTVDNVLDFSEANDLDANKLYCVLRGERKSHKGWRI